jgi:hypothetical protein
MSEPEHQRRANELGRLWQSQVMSVEDENVVASQRARVVPSIAAAIERAAAGRRKALLRRRFVAGLSVAAAVACTFGIGRLLVGHHGPAESAIAAAAKGSDVRALTGVVTLVNGNGPVTVSRANVEVGDALSTAADARAELRLTDLVLAELGGSSELAVVTPTASAHRLRLDRGHIRAKVDERPSAAPKLVVETPNVDVVVIGTVFQVDVVPGRAAGEFVTTVGVTKGRVVVRHGAMQVASVAAGQSWSSGAVAITPQRVEAPTAATPVRVGPRRQIAAGARPLRPGTLAEENALFQGAVDARNGGDDRAEADRLGALLNRYPGSPLAGEARVERMRALQRTGQGAEAAREARRYLAENPDGFAREEARRLVMQGGMSSRPAP